MQAEVAAVIMDVVVNLAGGLLKKRKIVPIVVMFSAFIAVFFFNIGVNISDDPIPFIDIDILVKYNEKY